MAITIADIAKEAGVSISTVSRVMNGTKPVSPKFNINYICLFDYLFISS